MFQKAPPAANTSPLSGFQFSGEMRVDPRGRELTVAFVDINGATAFSRSLEPQRGG